MEFNLFTDLLSTVLTVDPDELTPESLLVEEFGLQSLDVVELIEKISAETGQDPNSFIIGDVRTVRDLYQSLCAGPAQDDAVTAAMDAWLPDDPMRDAQTLVDLVTMRAAWRPDDVAVVFGERVLTAGVLLQHVERVAQNLVATGVQAGDRVLLIMPNSLEFFAAFFAVQRLGAVSVPLFHLVQVERIARIARHCEPSAIITHQPLSDDQRTALSDALPEHLAPALLPISTLLTSNTSADLPAPPKPDQLAMLQYTSGTTGDPKGVMLTHQALIANLRQAIPTARFTQDDVFVSWLPVYHDMGLITMTLCPFYIGAKMVLLPVRLSGDAWLGAIAQHRGTVTAAPDFAFRYTLRTTRNLASYDVQSLRMALIAAEPIRSETVRQFEEALGLRGVVRPGYGLAESCVAVTFYPFEPVEIEVDEYNNVACGKPVPGTELSIRDETGKTLQSGEIGELCFRGPSQTLGYFRNQSATDALFTEDGFVRTGDIAKIDADGMMTIVDRKKNILILGGRTLSPRELEEVVEGVRGVRGVMVVGLPSKVSGEDVHVVVETKVEDGVVLEREIARVLRQQMAVRVAAVHVVKPGGLPRTYNGKLRYAAMREQLMRVVG